ncbi:TPA: hypothetical protein SAO52_004997 [Burkholderia vietnamiensis]|nr:hypothetical protein [Burkholderia vietnamiensis]
MPTITKKEAAAAARQRGESRFTAVCKRHGEAAHYASNSACVSCLVESSAERAAKRKQDPEAREICNAQTRNRNARRMVSDPAYIGERRAHSAARTWRRDTKATAMPASYATEREEMRKRYAALPSGHQMDHCTPKKAQDFQGNHVASGLHTLSNLQPVPQRLNGMKSAQFDPDNFRDQRPANAFPGGAWDPELTEQEWARAELLVRRYGHDRDATVRDIQAQIARQHAIYLQTNAA